MTDNVLEETPDRVVVADSDRTAFPTWPVDLDLGFDEMSTSEAWWIQLSVLDPESEPWRVAAAVVNLTDLQAQQLVDGLTRLINEGRERFAR